MGTMDRQAGHLSLAGNVLISQCTVSNVINIKHRYTEKTPG